MPGGVIEVRQNERLGVLERLWLPGFLRGLWVIARRARRAREGGRTPAPRPTAPHDRVARVRGLPILLADDGIPRCVGCGLCAQICPPGCIRVVASGSAEVAPGGEASVPVVPGVAGGAVEAFEIDMGRCFHCGLCEEVCPADALAMSPLVEIAAEARGDLVYDLDALLVPAALLAGRGAGSRGRG